MSASTKTRSNGPVRLDLAEPLERGADVEPHALRDARERERGAGDLRVLLVQLEGVEQAARRQGAREAHAAVAAERADLDDAPRRAGAGEHLEVQPVERAYLDRRQPGSAAARADLAQHVVLGRVDRLGPCGEGGVALAEPLHRGRAHATSATGMAPRAPRRTVRAGGRPGGTGGVRRRPPPRRAAAARDGRGRGRYEGAVITFTVSPDAAGQRLDKLVRKALRDVPLSHVYKMFRTRKVRVNGARGRAEQVVAAGRHGRDPRRRGAAPRARPEPARGRRRERAVTFRVLHEDADVLAVDKPAGLAAHPGTGITGATLVEMARAHLGTPDDLPPTEFKPSPAHRLDRDTSGVVLVAKHRKAMVRLTEIFTDGEEVKKTYLALVKGKMPREAGTIDLPLSEHEQTARSKSARGVNMQEALTRWKVVSVHEGRLAPRGAASRPAARTRIRRHLEAAGHPVAGDRRYGDFPCEPRRAAALGPPAHVPPRLAARAAAPHHRRAAPARGAAPGGARGGRSRARTSAPAGCARQASGRRPPGWRPARHGER